MECPLCKAQKCEKIHDRIWSMSSGEVFRCLSCDVTFLEPMLTPQQERDFYQNYNQHVKRRGVTVSGSPQELHDKSLPLAKERFHRISEFFIDTEKVMEIGPSTGAFLQLLEGKYCVAVEPDVDNRTFCNQFAEHSYSDLADVPDGEFFDVICMFHVFEHIREPSHFLELCRHHLAPGGKIIIEVPNSSDPLLSLYNCAAYKDFYYQPMHPFVHSLKSLRYVFSEQGFIEKKVLYHQRYDLVNHLTWLSSGTPGGNSEWTKLLGDNQYYKLALETAGMTDTIFYVVEDSESLE